MKTVYMDGVFDMFHIGHLKSIHQCLEFGDRLIIGVVSDHDATGYKRAPICTQINREEIVRNIKGVDEVISECPLRLTHDFITEHAIDVVVHGFSNENDRNTQLEFFKIPVELGIFQEIAYHKGISTTGIIEKISQLK